MDVGALVFHFRATLAGLGAVSSTAIFDPDWGNLVAVRIKNKV